MNTNVVLRGLAVLAANATRKQQELDAAVARAINDVAQDILNESQRAVPVDTGNLKGSARVTPATPEAPTATVTYGGTSAAYALAVHELHPTKSKYLEEPARDVASRRMSDSITIALRQELS